MDGLDFMRVLALETATGYLWYFGSRQVSSWEYLLLVLLLGGSYLWMDGEQSCSVVRRSWLEEQGMFFRCSWYLKYLSDDVIVFVLCP